MVKSGLVVSLNHADQTGIIECSKTKQEFFFSVNECFEGRLPRIWEHVTFIKDADFKTTDVAALIKSSSVKLRAA
jgi:hypothetical protein